MTVSVTRTKQWAWSKEKRTEDQGHLKAYIACLVRDALKKPRFAFVVEKQRKQLFSRPVVLPYDFKLSKTRCARVMLVSTRNIMVGLCTARKILN